MNLSLYIAGDSPIHRLPIWMKFSALVAGSSVLFLYSSLWLSCLALSLVVLFFYIARLSMKVIIDQLKPIAFFLVVIFIFQWYFESLFFAVNVAVRLCAVVLLAALITLTTKSSAIIASIERSFLWLRIFGVSSKKLGLTISLALRFIPVLFSIAQEIREAQKVRGLEKSIFALAIPIIIRTLRMANDVASAIDARSFDAS